MPLHGLAVAAARAFCGWQLLPDSLRCPARMTQRFNSIESVVADLQKGKMVIVVDDADRENEGDLIVAADKVTSGTVSFMVRHTSGVICVPMEGKDLDRLDLPLMTQ